MTLLASLRDWLKAQQLDAVLLSSRQNKQPHLGISTGSGYVVISRESAHILVDSRYYVELEEDVWQREEIVTTGVGFGVAIPHTKSQWIRHSSISIARLAKPIGWQSEMGEVELVIMLTLGANEGMNHVKVFSQLARKLVNKNFRQSLFAAQDAQSILTLLETELTF